MGQETENESGVWREDYAPSTICAGCAMKDAKGNCGGRSPGLCKTYGARVAAKVLLDPQAAAMVPQEALLSALRARGFCGTLLRAEVVRV